MRTVTVCLVEWTLASVSNYFQSLWLFFAFAMLLILSTVVRALSLYFSNISFCFWFVFVGHNALVSDNWWTISQRKLLIHLVIQLFAGVVLHSHFHSLSSIVYCFIDSLRIWISFVGWPYYFFALLVFRSDFEFEFEGNEIPYANRFFMHRTGLISIVVNQPQSSRTAFIRKWHLSIIFERDSRL